MPIDVPSKTRFQILQSATAKVWMLLLLISVPRFILVLQANKTGQYQWVSLIFVVMIMLPWLLYNKKGRYEMGIRKPKNGLGLLGAMALGLLCAGLIYYLMLFVFGDGIAHPYRYIARSYAQIPAGVLGDDRFMFFLIYSIISMTFSPLGEEFFYRGLVHEYFAKSLGHNHASRLDSAAFAVVHLAHFGIVYHQGSWRWLLWPSLVWMLALFLTCRAFFWARQKSGAIWGAVVAHAAFNLGMNYFIFYHLL